MPTMRTRPAAVAAGSRERGASIELGAYGPALHGTQRLVYLLLAANPDLDRKLLAAAAGIAAGTVARHEQVLVGLGMLDPETRCVLFPRTGLPPVM